MSILTYVPKTPLADFVESFWDNDRYAKQHTKERILPTPDVQLVIKLRGCDDRVRDDVLRTYDIRNAERTDTFRGPVVWGPHSEHSIIATTPLASCMGVIFKPGRAFPFFGSPASEFHGLKVPLRDLWGRAADELRVRLHEAATPSARFRILEQALLSQAHTNLECHPAVTFALKEFQAMPHDRTIAEVTERTGLSPRWFIELFRAQVGLSPKLYCRLRRFQTALTFIEHQPHPDWAHLACVCGYFDQAHFIRDFRSFSGLSPTNYLAGRVRKTTYVRTWMSCKIDSASS